MHRVFWACSVCDPMLDQCWSSVHNAGPTLTQHWFNVFRLCVCCDLTVVSFLPPPPPARPAGDHQNEHTTTQGGKCHLLFLPEAEKQAGGGAGAGGGMLLHCSPAQLRELALNNLEDGLYLLHTRVPEVLCTRPPPPAGLSNSICLSCLLQLPIF